MTGIFPLLKRIDMEKDFERTVFYKSYMTCVFVGLIGTVLCMIYNLFFTQVLHFPLSSIINVATLIFAVNILFLLVGAIYYWFVSMKGKGEWIFAGLFLLLTVIGIWRLQYFHRSDIPKVNIQFHYEASGIVLMLGLLAAVGIPLLFHNKKFAEYVL